MTLDMTGFGSWRRPDDGAPTEDRAYHVLVQREVSCWVRVTATSHRDAQEAAYRVPAAELPPGTARRGCWKAQPLKPRTKHGRVMVLSAADVCGGAPHQKLLRLDCGHNIWIPRELWFPDNPWCECTNTKCPSRGGL